MYDPFLDEKSLFQNKKVLHVTFFSHFVLSHAFHNTTSPNIGGGSTPSIVNGNCQINFLGTVLPKSPPVSENNVRGFHCLWSYFLYLEAFYSSNALVSGWFESVVPPLNTPWCHYRYYCQSM